MSICHGKELVHGIHFGFHENSWDYAGLVVPISLHPSIHRAGSWLVLYQVD